MNRKIVLGYDQADLQLRFGLQIWGAGGAKVEVTQEASLGPHHSRDQVPGNIILLCSAEGPQTTTRPERNIFKEPKLNKNSTEHGKYLVICFRTMF